MIDKKKSEGPSRAEVEALCLLLALGEGACDGGMLAARLGLPQHLADAVVEAVAALVPGGHVTVEGATLARTAEGARHLTERLTLWGAT